MLLIAAEIMAALIVKLNVSNKAKQEHLIAKWGMIFIFLLLALKKETVGIDLAGYKEQYEIAAVMPWNDFDYVYFEKGYLLLTKIFSKLGIPFQVFLVCLYTALCHSTYHLICNFSPNAMLSIMIFICYNFLVFSISALRQTIAMSLCIYAFLLCVRFTRKTTIAAFALNIAAVSIHESAIVFFAVLVAICMMNREVVVSGWSTLVVAIVVLRPIIWRVVQYFYNKTITPFDVGGNFVFLVGMVVFIAFTYYYYPSKRLKLKTDSNVIFCYDAFLVRTTFFCLMCYVVFTGGPLLRANMYFTLMLIPGIPIATAKYPYQLRFLLNMAMGIFLIILFYTQTLMINQLELCPYLFFWQ